MIDHPVATTVTPRSKPKPIRPEAHDKANKPTDKTPQVGDAARIVTVVVLISHDSMRVGEKATVPYTERVQHLINGGYLEAAIEDDPLGWLEIM